MKMMASADKVKESIHRKLDRGNLGVISLDDMLQILKALNLTDAEAFSFLKASAGCFVKYPEVIDFIWSKQNRMEKEPERQQEKTQHKQKETEMQQEKTQHKENEAKSVRSSARFKTGDGKEMQPQLRSSFKRACTVPLNSEQEDESPALMRARTTEQHAATRKVSIMEEPISPEALQRSNSRKWTMLGELRACHALRRSSFADSSFEGWNTSDGPEAFLTLMIHSASCCCSTTNILSRNALMEAVKRLKLEHLGGAEIDRIWERIQETLSGRLEELDLDTFCVAVSRSQSLKAFALQVNARASSLLFEVEKTYNYDLPTTENYKLDSMDFFGSYDYARKAGEAPKARDYNWHENYTKERQSWQDEIIRLTTLRHSPQARPWIVFSAGAMGCGKGFTFETMSTRGYFPIENIVRIDPDFFKQLMPEWQGYVQRGKDAGTLCHKESGYIQELCQEVALRNRQNIWVDGSLRDTNWFQTIFMDIRTRYPHYRIGIIYVRASEKITRQRILHRSQTTGRGVPEEKLQESIRGSRKSVFELSLLCDWVAYVKNESYPQLECFSIQDGTGTWEHMKNRFGTLEPAPHEFPNALAPAMLKRTCLSAVHDGQSEASLEGCRTIQIDLSFSNESYRTDPDSPRIKKRNFPYKRFSQRVSLTLTPLSNIGIPHGAAASSLRQSMGIPQEAAWIAYAMPQRDGKMDVDVHHGGFAFFDEKKQLLPVFLIIDKAHARVDEAGNESESAYSFEFSVPVRKEQSDIPESLLTQMRWADTRTPILLERGARRFAWVCDNELPEAKNMGGFLYANCDGAFFFFPVRVPIQ